MGVLNITKEDVKKFKPIPGDWYRIKITDYQQVADKDGAALHQYGAVILQSAKGDKKFADHPIPMTPPSNIQFSEKAAGMATNFINACAGRDAVGEDGGAFEMQDCVGKEILAKNEPKLYNSRQQNNWNDFMKAE